MNKYLCIISGAILLASPCYAQEKTYTAEADKLVITEQRVTKTDFASLRAIVEQATAEGNKFQAQSNDCFNTAANAQKLIDEGVKAGVTEKVEAKIEEVKPE